jgi:hypothetical protein
MQTEGIKKESKKAVPQLRPTLGFLYRENGSAISPKRKFKVTSLVKKRIKELKKAAKAEKPLGEKNG